MGVKVSDNVNPTIEPLIVYTSVLALTYMKVHVRYISYMGWGKNKSEIFERLVTL